MEKHFSRHLPYFLSFKFCIPYDPTAAAKINQHLGLGLIHRQCKTITFHTCFIGQGFSKCFTKRNSGIFNSMMFVNMQIAVYFYTKIYFPMPGNMFQHMIKESKAG